jgi:hypothetical protein
VALTVSRRRTSSTETRPPRMPAHRLLLMPADYPRRGQSERWFGAERHFLSFLVLRTAVLRLEVVPHIEVPGSGPVAQCGHGDNHSLRSNAPEQVGQQSHDRKEGDVAEQRDELCPPFDARRPVVVISVAIRGSLRPLRPGIQPAPRLRPPALGMTGNAGSERSGTYEPDEGGRPPCSLRLIVRLN